METLSAYASLVQPPSPHAEVFKDDCMYCFTTSFDEEGLNICLHCLQSFCTSHDGDHQAAFPDHRLYLNYAKKLKPVSERQEQPTKMAKLEIKEKTEDELYDLFTKIYNISTDQYIEYQKQDLPMSIAMTVDAIIKSQSAERKEEVKAWEQEIIPCEHAFDIVQPPPAKINLQHCSGCELAENLWICLHCGNVGCGRQQFGGVPGNSHAKAHAEESGHSVAVKLGSLTFDSADAYCYTCNDEIKVPELAKLLKTFEINIAEQEKTEKSLTELQIEQNLKWDFNMDNKDGGVLQPVFGEKLTGFKNLGNSCYLASVLQVLFSFDSFEKEFYKQNIDYTNTHPEKDLRTQLIKVANGLLSGYYSVPDQTTSEVVKYQKGVKPSAFKALVGKDHPEFGTMKQQDASEFWGFLVEKIDQLYASSFDSNPANIFKFVTETKLSSAAGEIKLNEELNSSISLPLDAQVLSVDDEGNKTYKAVTFESMLSQWNALETVELGGKELGKQTGFKTTPDVLTVVAERIQLVNWVPTKVEVPIELPDSIDVFPYMSTGQQPGETIIQDEEGEGTTGFSPNTAALEQLQAMGFPEPRCLKALYNTGNDSAEDAMNWLFAHMEDPDIDDPFVLQEQSAGGQSGPDQPPAELISQIAGMGFSEKLAAKALVLNANNADMAINWIFENPDDDGELTTASKPATISDADIIEKLKSNASPSTVYKLQAIICHKGSSIHSGHYVCFIKKVVDGEQKWVLFNDEKVVISDDSNLKEMQSSGYMYIFVKS